MPNVITIKVPDSLLRESIDAVSNDAWYDSDHPSWATSTDLEPAPGSLRYKVKLTKKVPTSPYAFISGEAEDVEHALVLLGWAAELSRTYDGGDPDRVRLGKRWTKSLLKIAEKHPQFAKAIKDALAA